MTDESPKRVKIPESASGEFSYRLQEAEDLYYRLSKDAVRFSRQSDGEELFTLSSEEFKDLAQRQETLARNLQPIDAQFLGAIISEFAQNQRADEITGILKQPDGFYVVFITDTRSDPKKPIGYEVRSYGEYYVVRNAILYRSYSAYMPR